MILEVECFHSNEGLVQEQIETFGKAIVELREWKQPVSFLVESIDRIEPYENHPERSVVYLQSGSVFLVHLPYLSLRMVWCEHDTFLSMTPESLTKKEAVEK